MLKLSSCKTDATLQSVCCSLSVLDMRPLLGLNWWQAFSCGQDHPLYLYISPVFFRPLAAGSNAAWPPRACPWQGGQKGHCCLMDSSGRLHYRVRPTALKANDSMSQWKGNCISMFSIIILAINAKINMDLVCFFPLNCSPQTLLITIYYIYRYAGNG